VAFSDVTGWNKPDLQWVTVNDGQMAIATGTYTRQTGSLTVTITPQAAIDAGAKWRRAGTSDWKDSGAAETGVLVGPQTLEFNDVTWWNKPGNQVATVTNGQTATATGTYTRQTGSLTVTITPQAAIDAGAKWRRIGTTTWKDSGTTETGVPT
jgi:hypothetical protein